MRKVLTDDRRHRCRALDPLVAALIAVLCMTLAGCAPRKETVFSGRTMGTTYGVKLVTGYLKPVSGLKAQIDRRLDEINRSMSTYSADSEISRFNRLAVPGEKFPVSEDFIRVVQTARKIFMITDGAWDGTVKPLVELWGFGAEARMTLPSRAAVQQRLATVGFDAVEIVDGRYLVKRKAAVSLDLASIAKGYGVDQIAVLLRNAGIEDFLVEIGGEVYAAGHRKDRRPWRVGINDPRKEAPPDRVYRVVELTGKAMATSGDYRNFFVSGGKTYSHVIDPRSGYPAANGVVSASVLAADCTVADGLATALMVMGPHAGIKLIDRLEGVAALIVVMQADGSLVDHFSQAFPARD